MPPKSINPSSSAPINETIISDEDIVSSLANKLNIKEKQIRLYPKRRGCCYLEIDNHSVEAMLALKKVVEEYLYQGMIRRNSVTFDQEKITLSLYKEQIEVIIGEKLSKEQNQTILHHFIHFQESTQKVEDKSILVQFINKTDIDRGITGKKLAHSLNSQIAMEIEYKDIKNKLGPMQTLFIGYDDAECSLIWTSKPDIYQEYRQTTIQCCRDICNFREHASKDTIYPSLFEKFAHKITQKMLLAKRRYGDHFNVLQDLNILPAEEGHSYYAEIALDTPDLKKKLTLYRERMMRYAKKHQLDLQPISIKNNQLILTHDAYQNWQKILTKETAKAPRSAQGNTPFSYYPTPFGEFYLHFPNNQESAEIVSHLNMHSICLISNYRI